MSNVGHILYIVDFYAPHKWGVETVFSNIIKRLLKKWYTITVITSRYDSALPIKEIEGSLTIHRTGSGRITFMRKAYHLGKQILWENPSIDIIHGSSYSGVRPTVLLAHKFKKRSVVTVHEVFGKLRNRWKGGTWFLYRFFERSLFWKKADVYHCVSYYTYNALRLLYWIDDEKLYVIHNGVDQSWSQTKLLANKNRKSEEQGVTHAEEYNILYYGHAGYSKWVDFFINGLLAIQERIPHAHFTFNFIASKRTSSIIKRIKKIGVSSLTISQELPINDLQRLILRSDLIVVPSLVEWFGSVVSEVSTLWKPLVTTFAGAIPEASRGQVTYVPPSDTPWLVQAVVDTYTRKNSTKKEPMKKYSWDTSVEELEKVYNQK